MKWRPDYLAEQCLERMGITWKPATISASDIDRKASEKNCARATALDAGTVENYASAMGRDEVFPRICVVRRGTQYVIAGGNHRHAAALKRGAKEFEAMVVSELDTHGFNLLCKALNARSGLQVPVELRIEQAYELVKRYSIPASEAAVQMNVSVDSIRNYTLAYGVFELAATLNADCKFNNSVAAELGSIKSRPVRERVIREIGRVKIDRKEIQDLKKRLSAIETEAELLEATSNWVADVRKTVRTTRGKSLRPNRTNILHGIAMVENTINSITTVEQSQMTTIELQELVAKCLVIARAISLIAGTGSKDVSK
jgi:hypothetical protein